MNASTSPFYPLFASLDVNAKIHEGKAGEMLWDRCIELGIEARKKLREFGRHYAKTGRSDEEKWFFDPFVPDVVTIRGSKFAGYVTDTALGGSAHGRHQARAAVLELPSRRASGTDTAGYADGYAMVDPNKLALLTPGIDRKTGEYLNFGVPATVVANYLREQRVVPEKCDLNSILFLMTPAEDESKLEHADRAGLSNSRTCGIAMRPCTRSCRRSMRRTAKRYAGYTLRQVCNEMHDFYREANVKDCSGGASARRVFLELAMSPKDA